MSSETASLPSPMKLPNQSGREMDNYKMEEEMGTGLGIDKGFPSGETHVLNDN